LRSTSRASRVTNPAARSGLRNVPSYSISARVSPWRIAPACPVVPPPSTFTSTSKRSSICTASSGCRTIMRAVWRPKNSSSVRSLMLMRPVPGRRRTRAVEVLRRPVP
jgi:hypothetical protein